MSDIIFERRAETFFFRFRRFPDLILLIILLREDKLSGSERYSFLLLSLLRAEDRSWGGDLLVLIGINFVINVGKSELY